VSQHWFGKFVFIMSSVYLLLRVCWCIFLGILPSVVYSRYPNHPPSIFRSKLFVRGGGVGGSTPEVVLTQHHDKQSEERYSRQMYTLGKRAHRLVRASTMYLYGPFSSGLMYECAKNLVLSGVGRIILLRPTNSNENHSKSNSDDLNSQSKILSKLAPTSYDDLGKAYQLNARAELKEKKRVKNLGTSQSHFKDIEENRNDENRKDEINDEDDVIILKSYLETLNPSVMISIQDYPIEASFVVPINNSIENDAVLIAIDQTHTTQCHLNRQCRDASIKFISLETCGYYAKLFCDFGQTFLVDDVDGETPLESPVQTITLDAGEKRDESLSQSSISLFVHCVDGERHDVSPGDVVQFFSNGIDSVLPECQFQVSKIKSPSEFLVECTNFKSQNEFEDIFHPSSRKSFTVRRVKLPTEVSFLPLELALPKALSSSDPLSSSMFALCDLEKTFDRQRRASILGSFLGLDAFLTRFGSYPTESTMNKFEELVSKHYFSENNIAKEDNGMPEYSNSILQSFARTCKAKFVPLQGILGAIGAQEALKAVSRLYNPVQQFLLFDCHEIMDENRDRLYVDGTSMSSHSVAQEYLLGTDACQTLAEMNIFVVGAGAIGCELLKNLAAMGAGHITLTDMDTIEHSNLSRQLLFRDKDIGTFKSVAAQHATSQFSPFVTVEAFTNKVGPDEDSPFNDEFWEGVDVTLNALDNVDARLFVDGQCVAYQKPLIDAGTLGSKGNVQVVIPFQSESYGSSLDPQDQAIPVCTLKNFPYLISHTIQWGRDLFEGFFVRRPKQVFDLGDLLQQSHEGQDFWQKLLANLGEEAANEAVTELHEDLLISQQIMELANAQKASLLWAVRTADKLFRKNILKLLQEHPLDSVDEDGNPFWTGARRPPMPLHYQMTLSDPGNFQQEKINENFISFVQACARLRLETLNQFIRDDEKPFISEEDTKNALHSYYTDQTLSEKSDTALIDECKSLISTMASPPIWNKLDFEKDDDSNGHVQFIAAASNLRAISYGIAPVDEMETRRVAGNIVPAMITTTALVSSLSCLELIKLVKKVSLSTHRNAFLNLALPFFAFTKPVPAERIPGIGGKEFTIWDRTVIKETSKIARKGGIKMSTLISRIMKAIGLSPDLFCVSSISLDAYLLFASYLHDDDSELKKKSLWDVISDALLEGSEGDEFAARGEETNEKSTMESIFRNSKSFVDLSVMIEDMTTGDEMEIPTVRVIRHRTDDSTNHFP
jgi:ubiquitin-activating enzyme E1